MILAMLRVMALNLIRDRGALAMAFLLPPMIFVIFAAIFSGSSGEEMRLQVAFGSSVEGGAVERFEAAIRGEPSFRVATETYRDADALRDAVRAGLADAGLFVSGELVAAAEPPFVVIVDPGKLMAGSIVAGQVQRLLADALPDVGLARTAPAVESLVGGFTPAQQARLDAAIARLAADAGTAEGGSALVEMRTVGEAGGSSSAVTYYAGAVAILFLLFSAMQSAATLIEERNSGIVDRLAVGPAGTDVVVFGKYLFLTAQGTIQVLLIFLVARFAYGVDLFSGIGPWTITTVLAAAAAAGLALAVASACTTKQQAQTISTFIVLVFSAVGGSMVPRYMMPPWLQDIGWYTPNAWAIEAYHGVLWRGEALGEMVDSFIPLALLGLAGVFAALVISRLRLKL